MSYLYIKHYTYITYIIIAGIKYIQFDVGYTLLQLYIKYCCQQHFGHFLQTKKLPVMGKHIQTVPVPEYKERAT